MVKVVEGWMCHGAKEGKSCQQMDGCARELRRVNTVKVVNRRMDVPWS